jgi:transcriptional regulator of acetoin/glycerol metabolism
VKDLPGNVRELKNVIEYAFAMGDGPVLEPSDLPPELVAGSRDRVAQILGISRVTLWRHMKALGITDEGR